MGTLTFTLSDSSSRCSRCKPEQSDSAVGFALMTVPEGNSRTRLGLSQIHVSM